MPAERIPAKIIKVLDEAPTDRVEVDVTDKFQEVVIFLAENGLEAILEEMSMPAVSMVKPKSISGEVTLHDL